MSKIFNVILMGSHSRILRKRVLRSGTTIHSNCSMEIGVGNGRINAGGSIRRLSYKMTEVVQVTEIAVIWIR